MELPSADYCGDPDLLYQVWVNLFSNAIKFTPEGGMIFARMQMEGDRVIVEIRDTGIGMTPEVQKHIFEKFYQGDPSRHVEGNGLGLALVKRIVDLSEGSIQVESAPGEGSCFLISLPLRQH
ncbi:MAG: ATP-binding protein [Lachnospiraceae bacterium]|nr:ATP-binding protein [Lachnospiraceae bacterium]